jgi:hypothetical protein
VRMAAASASVTVNIGVMWGGGACAASGSGSWYYRDILVTGVLERRDHGREPRKSLSRRPGLDPPVGTEKITIGK